MVYDPVKQTEALIRLARPIHWVKNLGVFAALIFSGRLLDQTQFISVFEAFIAFNFITSATYVFNDIMDKDRDKLHPRKKNRPIASGVISPELGFLYGLGLSFSALLLSLTISSVFTLFILLYLGLQIAYSVYLKNLAVIDIIIIATGFVIRVYAGSYIIDAHLSVWFHLCVIATALFLASGKRRAELGAVGDSGTTRKSLTKYSKDTLNAYVSMFGNSAWMSWALFAFFESPHASQPLWLFLSEISKATTINKLLMVTIPVVIFGIMRYQSLIFLDKTEAPEKVLLTDPTLIASISLWIGIVLLIFYGGVAI